jgi:hypothetical protein
VIRVTVTLGLSCRLAFLTSAVVGTVTSPIANPLLHFLDGLLALAPQSKRCREHFFVVRFPADERRVPLAFFLVTVEKQSGIASLKVEHLPTRPGIVGAVIHDGSAMAFANLFSQFLSLRIGAKTEMEAKKRGSNRRSAGK